MCCLNKFEDIMNEITKIGLLLIENQSDFFENLIGEMKNIFDLPEIILKQLRKTSYTSYNQILLVPRAFLHNIFYYWGALAIKEENFNVLDKLLNLEVLINDFSLPNSQIKRIWETMGGDNLSTFRRSSIKAFKHLINTYNDKEFLLDFFEDLEDFNKFIYQFNFICCLYGLKMSSYVYPHCSEIDRYDIRLYIEPILSKIKNNGDFSSSISKLFGDLEINSSGVQKEIFIEEFPKRCKELNSRSRGEFAFDELPCDYFN